MSDGLHIDYGSEVYAGKDEDGEECLVIGNSAFHVPAQTVTFSAPTGSPDRASHIDQLIEALRRLR